MHWCVPRKGLQPETSPLGTRLLATCRIRADPAPSNQHGGRYAAAFLISFLRHGEICHFDEGAILRDFALPHRTNEFPAGYSLAGCSPAVPAPASPSDAHLARKLLLGPIKFQRMVNSVLTVCLSPGDHPTIAPAVESQPSHLPPTREIPKCH